MDLVTAQKNQRPAQSPEIITCVVVGLNESALLQICLQKLQTVGPIIYIDLGSKDDSVLVASNNGAKVIPHEWVPIVEIVHSKLSSFVTTDWILFVDPDEHLDETLLADVSELSEKLEGFGDVGVVSAPWQFYFKRQPLKTTPWGGIKHRDFLAHKDRFLFKPQVHRGRQLEAGYRRLDMQTAGLIHHYWSDSWGHLIKKHLRYLGKEGQSRFSDGERISLGGVVASGARIARENLRARQFLPDGIRGLFLVLLWVFYKVGALFALWLTQRSAR